jgi:hypothetical protein
VRRHRSTVRWETRRALPIKAVANPSTASRWQAAR